MTLKEREIDDQASSKLHASQSVTRIKKPLRAAVFPENDKLTF